MYRAASGLPHPADVTHLLGRSLGSWRVSPSPRTAEQGLASSEDSLVGHVPAERSTSSNHANCQPPSIADQNAHQTPRALIARDDRTPKKHFRPQPACSAKHPTEIAAGCDGCHEASLRLDLTNNSSSVMAVDQISACGYQCHLEVSNLSVGSPSQIRKRRCFEPQASSTWPPISNASCRTPLASSGEWISFCNRSPCS